MSNDDKKLPATSHWTPEVFRGEPPRATKEASPMPGEALPRACIDAGECQRRAIIEAVRRETVEASAKAIEATILDPDSLGADLKRRCAAIVRGAAIRAASSPVGSAREAADSSGAASEVRELLDILEEVLSSEPDMPGHQDTIDRADKILVAHGRSGS